MDTQLLRSFMTLAQTKNFTHASKLLHLSQSALSLQIQRLEEIVGKKAFTRNKRHVSLTSDGEALLSHAKRIIQQEDQMLSHFQQIEVQGDVKFAAPEDITTFYLPKILGAFVKSHPSIALEVNCEFTLNILKGFEEQKYDIILIKQDPKNPIPSSTGIKKEKLVWVCHEELKFFDGSEDTIPLIVTPSPCVYRKIALDSINQSGLRWKIVYTSPSYTGIIAAVKAGLGMTLLPQKMVPKELKILKKFPIVQDAEIALLIKPHASKAAQALAEYITIQINGV